MAKDLIKKVARLGGVDLRRYDKSLDHYLKLYEKYRHFTMLSRETFVLNLSLVHQFRKVSGDFVECGVWKGGMSAAAAELLGKGVKLHLFDSFAGLPKAREIDGKEAIAWQQNTHSPNYHDNCEANESFAMDAMKRSGNENFRIYKGWFKDTLSTFDGKRIAILRLDADWYDSILECLSGLFPKVAEGGIVILDDYYTWDGCAKAVHEYLTEVKSPSRIYQLNNQVPFILKKS